MRIRLLVIAMLLSAAGCGRAEPLLWGGLKAGPYAVGYRSTWTQDDTRQFDAKLPDGSQFGSGKTPRPIFVNEWYPAERPAGKVPMTQGEYLTLAPSTGKLHLLGEALIQFSRSMDAQWVVDADDPKRPTAAQEAALKRYYSAPTAAFRDAPAQPGKFPVVIYVHGSGSSFEDNSVMAEYLASQGYVVITSGFQSEDLFMIGSNQEVGDDLQFLIHYAGKLACCVGQKVGLVGQSRGAQNVLTYQSRDGAMADALVSLDTSEDYSYTNDIRFKGFFARMEADLGGVPILLAARPEAMFQLADTIANSHRYYLTERDTRHNEFISDGLTRTIVLNTPDREAVDRKFSALCQNILGFLGATLKPGPSGAWPQHGVVDFENQEVNLQDVPAGSSAPAYMGGDRPPTPRQFKDLVVKGKYDAAIAAVDKFCDGTKLHPFCASPDATIDFLLDEEQPDAGRRFSEAYGRVDPKFDADAFDLGMADQFVKWGEKQNAIRFYKKAMLLNASDDRAIAGLKKAEALTAP